MKYVTDLCSRYFPDDRKKDVEKQQGKENKSWFSMPAVQQCLPA